MLSFKVKTDIKTFEKVQTVIFNGLCFQFVSQSSQFEYLPVSRW